MASRQRDLEYIFEHELPLRDLGEAERFLYEALPSSSQALFRNGEGMARTRQFLHLIGDPQEASRTVHIAGTTGKGSTAIYLSGLLAEHGFHVGTHVSPHVYDIRERAMLDMKLLPPKRFVHCVDQLIPAIKTMSRHKRLGRPTYFEVVSAIAFSLFRDEKVDYGIVETGLGGLFDPTNSIRRPDKLAVITRLGLDHTEILGRSLPDIARQKAGILPIGGEGLYLVPKDHHAELAITETGRQHKTKLYPVQTPPTAGRLNADGVTFDYDDGHVKIKDISLPTYANYQVENAWVALCAALHLAQRDGFKLKPGLVRKAFARIRIPGRMELRRLGNKTVLLDGAHNPQKIGGLIESIKHLKLPKKPIWVFACKADKDTVKMLKTIAPQAAGIVFSQFFTHQANPRLAGMAHRADELAKLAALHTNLKVISAQPEPGAALDAALAAASQGQSVIVTGSFYFLGELKDKLDELSKPKPRRRSPPAG